MLDPTTQLPPNHFQTSKPTGRITDDHHQTPPTMSFQNRAKTTTETHDQNNMNWSVTHVQFRPKHDDQEEDESGVVSPPLWKSSPPRSHPQSNYRYLSPNSRSQAIARGQRELMEMVKHMPESCYELSLKDLVEHNRLGSQSQEEECLVDLKSLEVDEKVKVIKRQGSKVGGDHKGKMMRSKSHENGGLLLKMVLPFSLESKKKNKKSINNGPCAKVSPKPDQKSGSDQAKEKSWKGVDKEWWKKRFSVSSESESESGIFSINSGSSGSSRGSSSRSNRNSYRRRSGCSPGCWFFLSKKNKRSAE